MRRDSRSGDDSDCVGSEQSPVQPRVQAPTAQYWKHRSIKGSMETGVLFPDVSLQLPTLCMEALPELQAASQLFCAMAVDGFPLIYLIFLNPFIPLDPKSVTSTFNYHGVKSVSFLL